MRFNSGADGRYIKNIIRRIPMKKITLILISALLLVSFAACGSGEKYGYYDYDLSKYVEIGQFKGIEVSSADIAVSDDEVDGAVREILDNNGISVLADVTDRPVQSGDTVNIDYQGLLDGVPFEGGTAEGSDLVIGSGQFIPGFEDGLIGAVVGEKRSLDLNFPDPYPNNTELSGAAVVFKVTVNSIKAKDYPELTDDIVKQVSEYTTVDEWLAEIRNATELEKKWNIVKKKVISSATALKYPDKELDTFVDSLNSSYQQYADNYGVSLDEFVETYMGMSKEEYDQQTLEYAQDYIKTEMVCVAIARREGISLTDEQFKDYVKHYAESYGYSSTDECLKACGKTSITIWGISDIVIQTAVDACVVK